MASSVVEIANLALNRLGERLITDLDNPADKAARACKAAWPQSRDKVLRGFDWDCVTTRARLSRLADAPLNRWAFAYALPADCLRVRAVNEASSHAPGEDDFAVQGRELLCDEDEVILTYVRRETDPSLYDASLVDVLAQRLAVDICVPLTGSEDLRRSMLGELEG